MSPISIRPRTPDDDSTIVAVINSHPSQMPPWTVEYLRFVLALRSGLVGETYVAALDGRVIGTATLRENRTPEPGSFFGIVSVHRDAEGRGTGRELAAHLLARAKVAGANRIYTFVEEDKLRGVTFAEKQGFEATGRAEQMSRLEVAKANLEGFAEAEEQLKATGIEIVTLAELGADDEDVLRKLYALDVEAHEDVPAVENFQIDPFEDWKSLYVFGVGRSADTCWVAANRDHFVGLARIQRQGDSAFNAFTGVARGYRGRGIARALKMRTVTWAKTNGVKYFYTGNDTENHSMLAINMRMGYELLPKSVEMVRRL